MLRKEQKLFVLNEEAVITEESYNGISKDKCMVCEKKIENLEKHLKDETHISKLIQPQTVIYGRNKIISRKIGENKIHCLTCNKIFPMSIATEHAYKQQHIALYQKCVSEFNLNRQSTLANDKQTPLRYMGKTQDEELNYLSDIQFIATQGFNKMCLLCNWRLIPDLVETHVNSFHHKSLLNLHTKRIEKLKNELQTKDVEQPMQPNTDKNKDNILDCLPQLHEGGLVLNFESEVAYCKKCKVIIDFCYENMRKHIVEHEKKVETVSSSQVTDDSKSEPKDNKTRILDSVTMFQVDGMVINFERELAHCKKCHVTVDFVHEAIAQHTEKHKQMEKKLVQYDDDNKTTNKKYLVIDDGKVIEIITKYQHVDSVAKVVTSSSSVYMIVNCQYYIHEYSFLCMTKSDTGETKCQICLETLTKEQENDHKDKHINEIMQIPIITYTVTEDAEFVRQLKPDVFHCGYCNIVKETWEEMLLHLTCEEHAELKLAAQWRFYTNTDKIIK